MKIIDGFVLRPLGEEFIVIGEGISQINFNKMISLNSTAAFLWENVEGKDFTVEDLTKLLTDNYEVEEERVAAQERGGLRFESDVCIDTQRQVRHDR